MRFKLVFLGLLLLGLFVLPNVYATTGQATLPVSITIGSSVAITLNETSISFGTVNPAANSTTRDVEISNTGSSTIVGIYAHPSTIDNETANPITAGTSSSYAASSFLAIKNATAATTGNYTYAGKLVWNDTSSTGAGWTFSTAETAKSNHTWGSLWIDGSAATDLYYWEIINGSAATAAQANCSVSSTKFYINTTRNQKSMTASGVTAATNAGTSTTWSTFYYSTGLLESYCIAISNNCQRFYLYRYDTNSTWPTCSLSQKLFAGSWVAGGAVKTFSLKMIVPPAIPSGATTAASLQIVASDT
jgi:hypothetical protein